VSTSTGRSSERSETSKVSSGCLEQVITKSEGNVLNTKRPLTVALPLGELPVLGDLAREVNHGVQRFSTQAVVLAISGLGAFGHDASVELDTALDFFFVVLTSDSTKLLPKKSRKRNQFQRYLVCKSNATETNKQRRRFKPPALISSSVSPKSPGTVDWTEDTKMQWLEISR